MNRKKIKEKHVLSDTLSSRGLSSSSSRRPAACPRDPIKSFLDSASKPRSDKGVISSRGLFAGSRILQAKVIKKSFKQGVNSTNVLDDANFELAENEVVALVGPSGCGKTTFLHMIGLLDLPSSGGIFIDGKNFIKASDRHRTLCRRHDIGFVYQSHNLLNDFTALENVMLPLRLQDISDKERIEQARNLLKKLNLHNRETHYPAQLSGGEQQRVAIARSLIHDPKIILADEPTGNLDSANAEIVLKLLFSMVRILKKSLVIVTHNDKIAKRADRIMTIKNGKLMAYKYKAHV